MKKNYKKGIAIIILLSFFHCSMLKAQQRKDICPEPKIKKGYIENLQQWRNNNTLHTPSYINQVRVFFHIVTNDNGSHPGATEEQVMDALETMKTNFSPGNICFIFAGLNYVADAGLNHINVISNSNAEEEFAAHAIPGCLNIFYLDTIKGENSNSGGNIGGLTFNSPGTMCIIGKWYIHGNTTTHEVGHCLGLFHTFATNGFGREFIDGTQCDVRGDYMCDTKADPYSFLGDGDDCFVINTVTHTYHGTCMDPGGNTNYDPPYQNMMSYWHHDPESFSSDQFEAMNNVIDNDDDIKGISSTNTFTLHDVSYNLGTLFRSAIRGFTTFNKVEFAGASQAGLFGNSITLLPGFYAHPQFFTVQVRATDCDLGSKSFVQNKTLLNKTVTNKTLAENNVPKTGLIIYPNPAINYFMVTYSKATPFNALLSVKNVQGVTVFKIQRSTITQLSEKVYLGNYAKGLYIVELFDGEKRLSAKVLVQ